MNCLRSVKLAIEMRRITSAVNRDWPSASLVPHYATGQPITADVVKRRSAPLNGREMLRHGELRGAQRRLTLHGGDGTDA